MRGTTTSDVQLTFATRRFPPRQVTLGTTLGACAVQLFAFLFAATVGFVIEALVSRGYERYPRISALGPFLSLIVFLNAIWINRQLRHRSACFVWIAGLLVFGGVLRDAYLGWDPRWDHGSRWQYVVNNVFPASNADCGSSECLGLLFTMFFVASIAYSIGALVGLRLGPKQKRSPFAPQGYRG